MAHNTPETDYDFDYFNSYPYAVEIFCGDTCEDVYRTESLSNAQAKFDSWEQDLSNINDYEVKMFQFNESTGTHDLIDYNGNVLE